MDLKTLKQIYLDRLAPRPDVRWGITGVAFVLYCIRIWTTGAFYLITYCLGIYLLHALILFLTPKGEMIPDPFENIEDDDYVPEAIDNEFKPFIRNLPEFDFWMFVTKTVGVALVGTYFDILDIPVYTPILVFYFIFMVGYTTKRLVAHMKKYNYNPFLQSKEYYKK
ncbi:Rer1-like protein [Encephalitozoon intestinalis ATCC 50506]|uniref:Protein RER1 n=1 Tax=Encephalitozoon intestinalis (strain ATCC 50506) TaxID=876142 RepID=E0S8K5_ENCIT|nr:Rer1-like protein [Encephalitozoon intestinalis ATCC 50506]ADM11999.1 Rer1-like protein [Encephalitozoon intestinalis ATCC 50506]UTX45787.1 Rer1-like protein [Encephalitozoon intestinalis]